MRVGTFPEPICLGARDGEIERQEGNVISVTSGYHRGYYLGDVPLSLSFIIAWRSRPNGVGTLRALPNEGQRGDPADEQPQQDQ
jgi:hypothetical protein